MTRLRHHVCVSPPAAGHGGTHDLRSIFRRRASSANAQRQSLSRAEMEAR